MPENTFPSHPVQVPFFPLGYEVVRNTTATFAELDDNELNEIRAGNLDVLPSDSPDRYLLEGRARTDVPPDQREVAYREGICFGLTMVRKRQRYMDDEGYAVPLVAFNPEEGPDFSSKPSQPLPWYLPGFVKQGMEELSNMHEVYSRPASYFATESSIAFVGLLKGLWLERGGHAFMDMEGIEKAADDYFSLGLGDTFELYSSLYDRGSEEPLSERPPHVMPLTFNSKRHFQPSDKEQSSTRIEWSLGPGALESAGSVATDMLGKPRNESGHRAITPRHGSDRIRNVWWNNYLPAGATVTDVHSFTATKVLDSPGRTAGIVEVGLKDTLQTYHLDKKDNIVIQNSAGDVHNVGFPFHITESMASEQGGTRMVRLCRDGKVIDLQDVDPDEDTFEALEEATREAIDNQVARARWIGSRLMEKALIHSDGLVSVIPYFTGAAATWVPHTDSLWAVVPSYIAGYAAGRAGVHGGRLWNRKRRTTDSIELPS